MSAIIEAKETFATLKELSQILNTGNGSLDEQSDTWLKTHQIFRTRLGNFGPLRSSL
jgi:hypothetical protein